MVFSIGEELVSDRYPELKSLADALPDGTVLDGEILPWKDGRVLPFGELQKRIGRKTLSKKLLEEVPAVLMAYDLIEGGGDDLREKPLAETQRARRYFFRREARLAYHGDTKGTKVEGGRSLRVFVAKFRWAIRALNLLSILCKFLRSLCGEAFFLK